MCMRSVEYSIKFHLFLVLTTVEPCVCSILSTAEHLVSVQYYHRTSFLFHLAKCIMSFDIAWRPLTFHILIFSSETALLHESKYLCKILYKYCSFLICRFKKASSSLNPRGLMNRNLVERIYVMSSIQMVHFVLIP
jgi:hypothetical protein